MHQLNLINSKIFNKDINSIIFLFIFASIYGGYLSYFPNESISFAKTFLNDYNFNHQNEFYLKGILESPITAQIYIPYFFLKIGINEEILNRAWSGLTCFISILSFYYFAKIIIKNNFYSILLSLIFLSHRFLNTHSYSIHYPVSFFYFGQMGMYMTLLSMSLLLNLKKNASISILIINFFCHASWGIFNLALFIIYSFVKKLNFKFYKIHILIIFLFSLVTIWGHLDYKNNLDFKIKDKLTQIKIGKLSEFKESIIAPEDKLVNNNKAYLRSHNPFLDNTMGVKIILFDIFKFLFFEILLIVLFFIFKNNLNKDLILFFKILISLTFCILVFKFIILENNFFLNLISNINIQILLIIDRMIITRFLNLNSLVVLIFPMSVLFYFASIEKNIMARFFLIFYFFIFSIFLLFNSFIVAEHLPTIKIEKIIQNMLIYITFPIACFYFLFQSRIEKLTFNKKIINETYQISIMIFFVVNLIYFPLAKSITNKNFFSKINNDFKLIASEKNSEIITSSFIHGYIDVMYLTKSPIIVPMFSIKKMNNNRDTNIYCEDKINSPFTESSEYFKFVEKCFKDRKKKEWLMYHKELGLNYVVTRSYLNLNLEKISSNNFVNIYKIQN